MSKPISNTTAPILGSAVMYPKIGERLTIGLPITVESGIDLTGIKGKSQIRDANGVLLYDYGEVSGTVDGSGVGLLIFDAPGTATANWPTGVYYWDALWYTATYGPKATKTYRVVVTSGPTQA